MKQYCPTSSTAGRLLGAKLGDCFLVVSIFLLTICGANACSWDHTVTNEQRFADATSVLIGHVVQTEEIESSAYGERRTIIQGAVRVVEMLKGPPAANVKIRSLVYGPTNCTIPIVAGFDYLLFVDDDKLIYYPGGSRVLPSLKEDLQDNETRQLLRSLRQLRDAR